MLWKTEGLLWHKTNAMEWRLIPVVTNVAQLYTQKDTGEKY